jgi:hypothetical protein
MSTPDGSKDSTAGYLAEYAFLAEGLRHNQRERHGFLAFSLAASGLILGLLMRSTPSRSATEACFLVGLAAGVTLVAERMTIRSSHGIGNAAAYLRLFVEPHVEGLDFQRRDALFKRKEGGAPSASRSFAYAYFALTAAFLLAWFAAPAHGGKQWWQTGIVASLAAASLFQIVHLNWIGHFGRNTSRKWNEIRGRGAAGDHPRRHLSSCRVIPRRVVRRPHGTIPSLPTGGSPAGSVPSSCPMTHEDVAHRRELVQVRLSLGVPTRQTRLARCVLAEGFQAGGELGDVDVGDFP